MLNLKPDDSIEMLFAAFIETIQQEDQAKAKNTKSLLRRFVKETSASTSIEDFVVNHGDYLDGINASGTVPYNSFRPLKSRVEAVAEWAHRQGIVQYSPDTARRIGLLPQKQFADWKCDPRALTVYKLLVKEMAYSKLEANDIDDGFVGAFLTSLEGRLSNWRQCWRDFTCRWNALSDEGFVPEVDFPTPPSKMRSRYATKEEDLPVHLRMAVGEMRSRLTGEAIDQREGFSPMQESTAELNISAFLRLCGFLQVERDVNLEEVQLPELLRIENAVRLIEFTNERAMRLYGIEIGKKDKKQYGEYERSTLLQLSAIVRVVLQDETLHRQYIEEIRHLSPLVDKRREALKDHGHPDDYLRVALELWKRAESSSVVRAATHRRNAMIITLMAIYAYRVSVVAGIHLKENLRFSDDRTSALLCFSKERSKPRKRDLQHEVMVELIPMLHQVDRDRALLLKGCQDHGYLWIGQGGRPLSSHAIYYMFHKYTGEILGVSKNPHQARKAWATAWGHFSGGDFLTASSIMDSSPLTIQKHYFSLNVFQKHEEHDQVVAEKWQALEPALASTNLEVASHV